MCFIISCYDRLPFWGYWAVWSVFCSKIQNWFHGVLLEYWGLDKRVPLGQDLNVCAGKIACSKKWAIVSVAFWCNNFKICFSFFLLVFRCCMLIAIWPVRNSGKCLMARCTTSWGSNFIVMMLFQRCMIKSANLQDIKSDSPEQEIGWSWILQ